MRGLVPASKRSWLCWNDLFDARPATDMSRHLPPILDAHRATLLRALEAATEPDVAYSIVDSASRSLRDEAAEHELQGFWVAVLDDIEALATNSAAIRDGLRAAVRISILTAAQVAILQHQGRIPKRRGAVIKRNSDGETSSDPFQWPE